VAVKEMLKLSENSFSNIGWLVGVLFSSENNEGNRKQMTL
jgi:hypothetical protein